MDRALPILTVVDDFTRECLVVDTSLTALRAMRELDYIIKGGKALARTHVRKMLKRFGELVADLSQLVEIGLYTGSLGLAK